MLLLAPALAVYGISFLAPMARLGRMSLGWTDEMGVMHEGLSAANYTSISQSAYSLGLIWHSLMFGVAVSCTDLILSYPVALFLHRTTSRWKNTLLLLTISPLFISSIVRTYGWTLILGQEGVVNGLVALLNPGHKPLRLVNNMLGCYIGMVQILMPYMVLSLMSGFGRLSATHEEAARSLGAGPYQRLTTIVVPLSLPGVFLGLMVCFVLTVSSFVTPELLGGGRVQLLATEIYNQAVVQLEWPMASALSVTLLVVFGLLVAGYNRLTAHIDR